MYHSFCAAITQAFQATNEHAKRDRSAPIFSCEHCPMVWYHKLCTELEGTYVCWRWPLCFWYWLTWRIIAPLRRVNIMSRVLSKYKDVWFLEICVGKIVDPVSSSFREIAGDSDSRWWARTITIKGVCGNGYSHSFNDWDLVYISYCLKYPSCRGKRNAVCGVIMCSARSKYIFQLYPLNLASWWAFQRSICYWFFSTICS